MRMVRSKRGMSLLLGGAALALLFGAAFSSRTSDRAPEKILSDSSSTPVAPAPPAGAEAVETDVFRTEAETPTKDFTALLSEVEAGIAGESWGTPGFSALVTRLVDFLEAHPDAMEKAAAVIRSGDSAIALKWALIESLGRQSHADRAHTLLIGLAVDPVVPEQLKRTVVSCLSLTAIVPVKTIDFLQRLGAGEDSMADLALEILARNVFKLEEVRADKTIRFLETTLESRLASDDSERTAAALRALAFSGNASSAVMVNEVTRNGCPMIRGAALICMGKLAPGVGEARIRFALLNDPDAGVRLSALEALKPVPLGVAEEQSINSGRVSDSLLNDLLHVARSDTKERVRLQALRIFHQTWSRAPEQVLDTLRTMAVHDSSRNVRNWARWYLTYGFHS